VIPTATLERLLDRFHAIEAELASGTAGSGFVKLSKEHAELAPVVAAAHQIVLFSRMKLGVSFGGWHGAVPQALTSTTP